MQSLKKKLALGSKNDMSNLVSFNTSSGKSEKFHFDKLLLQKVCNVWAKKIWGTVVKNDIWFQKWSHLVNFHKKIESNVA